jgi:hypothetical protein
LEAERVFSIFGDTSDVSLSRIVFWTLELGLVEVVWKELKGCEGGVRVCSQELLFKRVFGRTEEVLKDISAASIDYMYLVYYISMKGLYGIL